MSKTATKHDFPHHQKNGKCPKHQINKFPQHLKKVSKTPTKNYPYHLKNFAKTSDTKKPKTPKNKITQNS